jgi:hypothetical protein
MPASGQTYQVGSVSPHPKKKILRLRKGIRSEPMGTLSTEEAFFTLRHRRAINSWGENKAISVISWFSLSCQHLHYTASNVTIEWWIGKDMEGSGIRKKKHELGVRIACVLAEIWTNHPRNTSSDRCRYNIKPGVNQDKPWDNGFLGRESIPVPRE